MEDQVICPYPGLRPFNEDEAIFFKGREEHIEQIVKQLEEKKFLMLTGASGDGKSSLVYAGVIPNARAGFFKAKFNNWIVADFRPEREPLKNMALAINEQLKINDPERIEKELSYGFSSLIDIYKKSPYWVDQQSESFLQLTADEQKKTKRKGANLLILVDQFEEFFTNPENYHSGKTSIESQSVINSLLETTRLALEQDIPIYIVCTMRSDYIGQCASFRGLPEYIGYSQFFVPRLKRKEIYQVIEEPAQLNGNKISKRLVEMLINEMNDGIDQLPVLQHSLNQIWQKADRGQVEMDLIHFAKINGIPKNQLTANDKIAFEEWFDAIPEFKKQFFAHSSLGDVLDAHANELYETADAFSETITADDAKLIVATAFKCLTKIDEARAVRNRMTLEEVTQIINQPHITNSIVAQVLYIFRIQGNTFLKPFIFDVNEDAVELSGNSVLDITHESLIRNWRKLTDWAREEYDNLLTWQDFNKQLQRWTNSNKSSGYLLPIGPLTFFENWFNTAKPNKYWLARYDEREISKEQKLEDAEKILANTRQFIKRSARRLFINRTVIKYGADKIIAVFGACLLMFGCLYFYFDFRKKQNSYVIEEVEHKGLDLLHSNKVKNSVKAQFLINFERLHPNTTEQNLNSLNNDTLSYDLAFTYFGLVQNYDDENFKDKALIVNRLEKYMDSIIYKTILNTDHNLMQNVKRMNQHMRLCGYVYHYNKTESSNRILLKSLRCAEKYISICLKEPKLANTEEFNSSLKLLLTLSPRHLLKINKIISEITPFDEKKSETFDVLYPKDQTIKVDWEHYLTHKGGYQILAYLYACNGEYGNLERCLDSLYKQNTDYKLNGYEGITDIKNFIVKYQDFPSPDFEVILNKYIKRFSLESNVNNFYNELINHRFLSKLRFNDISRNTNNDVLMNLIKSFITDEKWDAVFNNNLEYLRASHPEKLERELNVALFYKKLGCYFKTIKKDDINASAYFKKALDLYNNLPSEFLEHDFVFYDYKNKPVQGNQKIKNSVAFLYPIAMSENAWSPFDDYFCDANNCYGNSLRQGSPFFEYVSHNNLTYLYKSKEDFMALEKFSYKLINSTQKNDYLNDSIIYKHFHQITNLILSNENYYNILDKNFVQLVNLRKNLLINDTTMCNIAYNKMDLDKIINPSFQKLENLKSNIHKQLMAELCYHLARKNMKVEAKKVYNSIEEPWLKRNCLIDVSYKLLEQEYLTNSFTYIDLILPDIKAKPKFGMKLFRVFGLLGTRLTDEIAMNIFKDIDDKLKPRGLNNFIRGVAESGLYYKALSFIPSSVSSVNELDLYNEILHAEVLKLQRLKIGNSEDDNWNRIDLNAYGEYTPQNYEFEGEHFDRFVD